MSKQSFRLKSDYTQHYVLPQDLKLEAEAMSGARIIFSAFALLLGCLMMYVSLHYIPAFLQPREVIRSVSHQSIPPEKKPLNLFKPFGKTLSPYFDLFKLDHAYMQAGETIEVRYNLPAGSEMEVTINRCKRAWITEIFRCDPLHETHKIVNNAQNIKRFQIKKEGFYYFTEAIKLPPEDTKYRVMWRRP